MAHDPTSVASGGPGWLGTLGGDWGQWRGHPSVVTAGVLMPLLRISPIATQPKSTQLIKRGETKGEKEGNRFHDFCDTMRNRFLWGGGNWVELGMEDQRNSLTVFKNSKCKTSVIKSLKIAYISGLTKKRKIWKSGQGNIYQFPND